jgi:hypothetical protein
MRKAVTFATLLAAITLGQNGLLACGDKFFLVGRGDTFKRAYASLHPGSVVLYAGGTSEISKGLRDARMTRHIGRAGHRVRLVTDRTQLDQVLQSERVDLILTDILQAIDLQPGLASLPSEPTLLPIETKGRRQSPDGFDVTLKTSDNVKVLLDKIEKLMKARKSNAARP